MEPSGVFFSERNGRTPRHRRPHDKRIPNLSEHTRRTRYLPATNLPLTCKKHGLSGGRLSIYNLRYTCIFLFL